MANEREFTCSGAVTVSDWVASPMPSSSVQGPPATHGYTFVYPNARVLTMATKDSGLRIRVEVELRDDFVSACRQQGRPAAEVLREFMREYVRRTKGGAQDELFRHDSVG